MIKELSILFLLDFSGSMEQPLKNEIKYKTLQKQSAALLSTFDERSQVRSIVLGSRPDLRCEDLVESTGSPAQQRKYIQSLSPGAFGMTPLAAGLKKAIKSVVDGRVSTVIALTDGGDSCGEDPCKVLSDADDILGKKKKVFNLVLIGFDLKYHKQKLSCFREGRFKNINVVFSEAADGEELQNALKKAQELSLGLSVKAGDLFVSKVEHPEKGTAKDDSKEGRSEHSTSGVNIKSENLENSAFVEVLGAPLGATFLLTGPVKKNWEGPFVVSVPPGPYRLGYESEDGISINLQLARQQRLKIPWAKLLKDPTVSLVLSDAILTTAWTPDDRTVEIHGERKEFTFRLDDTEKIFAIPFGRYQVKVIGPVWVPQMERALEVPHNADMKMSIKDLFHEKVVSVRNPYKGEMSVLEVESSSGAFERHLVRGDGNIPLERGKKFRFLKK